MQIWRVQCSTIAWWQNWETNLQMNCSVSVPVYEMVFKEKNKVVLCWDRNTYCCYVVTLFLSNFQIIFRSSSEKSFNSYHTYVIFKQQNSKVTIIFFLQTCSCFQSGDQFWPICRFAYIIRLGITFVQDQFCSRRRHVHPNWYFEDIFNIKLFVGRIGQFSSVISLPSSFKFYAELSSRSCIFLILFKPGFHSDGDTIVESCDPSRSKLLAWRLIKLQDNIMNKPASGLQVNRFLT